jgi:flavodoxin
MENSVIYVYSYHGLSTLKISNVIGTKIGASIINIKNNPESAKIDNYDLIGFGAGIAGGKHYSKMLRFAENLPSVKNKKAFIFSTSRNGGKKIINDHMALKNILSNKGFIVIDEFSCKGFVFWGYNRNRPNNDDIKNAEIFAGKLLNNI